MNLLGKPYTTEECDSAAIKKNFLSKYSDYTYPACKTQCFIDAVARSCGCDYYATCKSFF